ncbi:protein FAR1-RELATED SEQUENCE 7-like [Rosa rugosa]|uniref:protein FAR1-RELATED SEQUENCE 7-like n=1 Tax=Rosa rugosa TaxID=74645 RepID=UPI002B411DF3|nr:protein FAR1-RELATED SEQUENCE 7-like [Rosa rugosa]
MKDLHNRVDEEHKEMYIDGDGQGAISFMNLKALKDPDFYCLFIVDVEASFVICFGETQDKTEDTYNLVLIAFLDSMKGKRPIYVITDRDEAMRNAVNRLIPKAQHQLSAWHIAKNVVKNVGNIDVHRDFCHFIFAGFSVEDWKKLWHYTVAIHGLQDNCWVSSMCSKQDRWAEAYFRSHFFGVEQMRYNNLYDDFKSMNSDPLIGRNMRCLQEQVGAKFTHDIFLLIKDQIMFESKFVVADHLDYENRSSTLFVITQYGKSERTWHVTYLHGRPCIYFKCSCQLFESDGIPRCHIFTVMKTKLLTNFPESLVTQRWRNEASPEKTHLIRKSDNVSSVDIQLARYGQMMSDSSRICHSTS